MKSERRSETYRFSPVFFVSSCNFQVAALCNFRLRSAPLLLTPEHLLAICQIKRIPTNASLGTAFVLELSVKQAAASRRVVDLSLQAEPRYDATARRRSDRRMDGRTDGRTDRQTDRQKLFYVESRDRVLIASERRDHPIRLCRIHSPYNKNRVCQKFRILCFR